jgi:hypothetical protein
VITTTDSCGGVFASVPGKALRPAYGIGPKESKGPKDVMLTCPVSAIPERVWDLLSLWRSCRLMKTLPVAGGFEDQPFWVRYSFPIFEACDQASGGGNSTAEDAAMLAVGTMMKAMFGGRGR